MRYLNLAEMEQLLNECYNYACGVNLLIELSNHVVRDLNQKLCKLVFINY